MIAFAGMLVNPAEQAGIKVPENFDDFDPEQYPHWNVYLNVQLGAALPHSSSHWDNAKVIASIPENRIREVTFADLLAEGLSIST